MPPTPSRPNHVDRIDLGILTALYREARISKVQMSTEVGLSASRCYERMRRLEQTEVIRGYHADIDIARLASCLQFMVQIKLLNYTAARGKQFEQTILKIPEIIACQGVLGTIDYILVVIAATIEKYQDVIGKLRAASECEFDFVTFPVSNTIKSPGHSDLKQVVGRLMRDDAGGAIRSGPPGARNEPQRGPQSRAVRCAQEQAGDYGALAAAPGPLSAAAS